ncbi:hypothetical protein B0J13DRAFT_580747 [Dactylonectria estremocensis]|uniref:Amidohydrolase-related domain-containing protein n=1 Tax=Dactylonectria estremocensis TaxID=1079267 RepID=A0A9P9JBS0_9HYPO|nr:hypothetical protein B0J13DRAFT_580747 [Dactylonectria estremocensis]
MTFKGTVAIEEAVVNPDDVAWLSETAALFAPKNNSGQSQHHALSQKLADIHEERLQRMDAEGVEYMLLSLTSPGCQGEPDPVKASNLAVISNNWLAREVARNPRRFGGLAALSMHDASEAATELRRAVKELGMFGAMLNDFQSVDPNGSGAKYYDSPEYHVFWKTVEELDVPVYMHPRYPVASDLQPDGKYGPRKHLIGAAVQFHLDLSFHIYALCSSGIFDRFPKVQVVAGHLGEGIPFNLWRADHWYNKPVKRATRPSKEDYRYYFHHNVSITTSGNFSTAGLKFCLEEVGVERCLFAIDYPYDTIEEAQTWWRGVDLSAEQKQLIGRENSIRLFKLPLEP